MGNLENDDIEEKASLKTVTSDITNNDNSEESNRIKSGNHKQTNNELSKNHNSSETPRPLENGGDKLQGDLIENGLTNGIRNENNDIEMHISESNVSTFDKIDTNAEVHAEDESKNISHSETDTASEQKLTSGKVGTGDIDSESKKTNTISKATEAVSPEDNEVKTEIKFTSVRSEDKEKDILLTVNDQNITKSNESSDLPDKKSHKDSLIITDNRDAGAQTEKSTEQILENTKKPEAKSKNQTNQTTEDYERYPVAIPNKYLMRGDENSSPKVAKRPLRRSVSDNFLIKSTSSNTSPIQIIDSLTSCHIDIDNDVLLQNTINAYKSDATLQNLTKLQLIKRSISETLMGLKTKLIRTNRINNNSDQKVKLITIGSQAKVDDDEELLDNIQAPNEMKSTSLESIVDAEVEDKENAWLVDRNMDNGVDILKR